MLRAGLCGELSVVFSLRASTSLGFHAAWVGTGPTKRDRT
jgi:hypothetical protein